jgi:hypothetical protein
MIRRGPADAAARAVGLELSAWCPGVEYLADSNTTGDELFTGSLNVGDDQVRDRGQSRARPT